MAARKRRNRAKHDSMGAGERVAGSPSPLSEAQHVPTDGPDDESSDSACESEGKGISEETYLKERTTLIDIEQKSSDQHDKAILTISMGGLALSLTFLKDIAPNPRPETLRLVTLSWAFFVFSMLTILFSFLTSQLACRKQRDFLDELYSQGTSASIEKANCWSRLTHILNFVSYFSVFVAIALLTWFSSSNLANRGDLMPPGARNQTAQSTKPPLQIKGGTVPPKLPATPTSESKSDTSDQKGKPNKK